MCKSNLKVKRNILTTSFSIIPKSIVRCKALTAEDKLIYMTVLDCIRDEGGGRCFPTQERLAAETGISRRTVQRRLHRLRGVGLLDWDKGGMHASCPNSYYLCECPEWVYDNTEPDAENLPDSGSVTMAQPWRQDDASGSVTMANHKNTKEKETKRTDQFPPSPPEGADAESEGEPGSRSPRKSPLEEVLAEATEQTQTGRLRAKSQKKSKVVRASGRAHVESRNGPGKKKRVINFGAEDSSDQEGSSVETVREITVENLITEWERRFKIAFDLKSKADKGYARHMKFLLDTYGGEFVREMFDVVFDRWDEARESFGIKMGAPTIPLLRNMRDCFALVAKTGKFPKKVNGKPYDPKADISRPLETKWDDPNFNPKGWD